MYHKQVSGSNPPEAESCIGGAGYQGRGVPVQKNAQVSIHCQRSETARHPDLNSVPGYGMIISDLPTENLPSVRRTCRSESNEVVFLCAVLELLSLSKGAVDEAAETLQGCGLCGSIGSSNYGNDG